VLHQIEKPRERRSRSRSDAYPYGGVLRAANAEAKRAVIARANEHLLIEVDISLMLISKSIVPSLGGSMGASKLEERLELVGAAILEQGGVVLLRILDSMSIVRAT